MVSCKRVFENLTKSFIMNRGRLYARENALYFSERRTVT